MPGLEVVSTVMRGFSNRYEGAQVFGRIVVQLYIYIDKNKHIEPAPHLPASHKDVPVLHVCGSR